MSKRMTKKQATESARDFIRHIGERQWNTYNIDRSLPEGWEIRTGADWCDRLTIANMAAFIQVEAVRKPEWR